jgi:hypothetical protein
VLQQTEIVEYEVGQHISDGSKDGGENELIQELKQDPFSPPSSPEIEINIPPMVLVSLRPPDNDPLPTCVMNENEKSSSSMISAAPRKEMESKAMQTAVNLFGLKKNYIADKLGSVPQVITHKDAGKIPVQKRVSEPEPFQSVTVNKKFKSSNSETRKSKVSNQQNKITSFFNC